MRKVSFFYFFNCFFGVFSVFFLLGCARRTEVSVLLRGRELDLPAVVGRMMRLFAMITTSLPLNFFSSSRTSRSWILWNDFSRRNGTWRPQQGDSGQNVLLPKETVHACYDCLNMAPFPGQKANFHAAVAGRRVRASASRKSTG
jgi:hypothetical protein